MTTYQQPFPYEDIMESAIQSVIDRNNRFDPTGRANELRIPPRRIQQQLRRPKWYDPAQHAESPRISAAIAAAGPVLTTNGLSYSMDITVKLTHHENPAGNPDSQPVTFDISDTGLTDIGSGGEDAPLYPWLLLCHDSSAREGGLKEIEAENSEDGHGPAEMFERDNGNDEDAGEAELQEVKPENEFVTLAVGGTKTLEVHWQASGPLLKKGGHYQLCYRGIFVRWWRWGTAEELKGEKNTEQHRKTTERMWIPCTNVVEFRIEDS